MVNVEQTMERLRSDSQFQITVGLTVFFLAIFPAYFSYAASAADDAVLDSGESDMWYVSFNENTLEFTETVVLSDEDTHETSFAISEDDLAGMMIGYVEVAVSCSDNDDPGPGFTDSGAIESNLGDIESGDFSDQSDEGPCNGDAFSLRWDVTHNYTGEAFNWYGTHDEIHSTWNDMGWGRGTWAATVTADISSPPGPVGNVIDSDEEYDIEWTVVTYELELEAAEPV